MEKSHVKQHYIPQCYLKNFSSNGKYLHVYSKKNSKKGYPQAISNTACLNHFYDIPKKYLPEGVNTNTIEVEFFANNIEQKYNEILSDINSKISNLTTNKEIHQTIISENNREVFAELIAIQFLRTPHIRDMFWNANKKIHNETLEIIKSFVRRQNISEYNKSELKFLDEIKLKFNEDFQSLFHSDFFLDQNLIGNIKNCLINKFWIFYFPEKGSFMASDNPILLYPHLENQEPFYQGFGQKGIEIIFPLGSKTLLTIWDNNYFKLKKELHNTLNPMNDKELRRYNLYQYFWAKDEIYSGDNDFGIFTLIKFLNNNKEFIGCRSNIRINGK